MYGIFTYIYPKNQRNVGLYTSPMDATGLETRRERFRIPQGFFKVIPTRVVIIPANQGKKTPVSMTGLHCQHAAVQADVAPRVCMNVMAQMRM